MNDDKYSSDFVYIKDKIRPLAVSWWYELVIIFGDTIVLIGLGFVLPYIMKRERRS